jgi:nucleotide-binding universal stress UspA family protein
MNGDTLEADGRKGARTAPGRILVAIDFSAGSIAALERAAALAAETGAWLDLVHVRPGLCTTALEDLFLRDLRHETIGDTEEDRAGEVLADLLSGLDRLGVGAWAQLESGEPADEILRTAASVRYTAIFMGAHGSGGSSHPLRGSVADAVARGAPCPVMTCSPAARWPVQSALLARAS